MGAHFFERDFQLPALYEPGDDLYRVSPAVRAQQSLRLEFVLRVADENPAQRHSGHPAVIPDRRAGGDFYRALFVAVPGDRGLRPSRFRVVQPGLQCG